MPAAALVTTVVLAAGLGSSGVIDFVRPAWLLDNMGRLGIPLDRLTLFGALKVAGAVGLLVGPAVPAVGVAAGVGLVLYFVGAVVTVLRAGWTEHLPYPVAYLALAAGALALQVVHVTSW